MLFCVFHTYIIRKDRCQAAGYEKKIGHLVMWVEFGVLTILLARFCAVRIGENVEGIRGFLVQKQENTESISKKIEKETASDKVIGVSDGRDGRTGYARRYIRRYDGRGLSGKEESCPNL